MSQKLQLLFLSLARVLLALGEHLCERLFWSVALVHCRVKTRLNNLGAKR